MAANLDNAIIIDITTNGSTILTTAGKYCDRNIEINTYVPVPDGYIKPAGNKSITTNGTHDVKSYENAVVNVPVPSGYIKPTGSKSITTNGTHDVTSVASAVVNVPVPSGYIKPSGSKSITTNGTHDVTNYASAVVNVETAKPTQFTNLYDPDIVTLKTMKSWDSSTNTFKSESQSNVNNIEIPYDHTANTPVALRLRGIGTVRDRFACYLLNENREYVNHYQLNNTSYFSLSYDEHGDALITFKGNAQTRAWKYFGLNFQYIGINSNATALTGPIITINEPIGNGGYVG